MTTIDSSTLHNRFVAGSQENLQEKKTVANSMHTQAPDGEPQKDIVQSSPEEFDAGAEAKEYWERQIIKMNKKINKAYEKSFHNDRLLYETYMKYLDNLEKKNTKIYFFREIIQAFLFACLLCLSASAILGFFSLISSFLRQNFLYQ